jgi:aryl-alcohol dehydrogenase-like predicted oxidoreductase
LGLISDLSQDETSEEFIGEWAEKRGIRDQLVIATKARLDPDVPAWHPRGITDNIASIQATTSVARIRSFTKRTTAGITQSLCASPLRRLSRSCARRTSTSCMYTGGIGPPQLKRL